MISNPLPFQCWSKAVHTEEVKVWVLLRDTPLYTFLNHCLTKEVSFPTATQLNPISDFEVNTVYVMC